MSASSVETDGASLGGWSDNVHGAAPAASSRGEHLKPVEAHELGERRRKRSFRARSLANVEPDQPRALIEGTIGRNVVNRVGGDSGSGKTLLFLNLIGRCQCGIRLPGEAEAYDGKRGLLWFQADDADAVCRRRAEAAGLDLEQTVIVSHPMVLNSPAVQRDLKDLIDERDIGFAFLETPELLLPPGVNANDNTEVRRHLMVPLRDIVERSEDLTVIFPQHLTKPGRNAPSDPIHRMAGATQWGAGARSKIYVGTDEHGPRGPDGRPRRFFGAVSLHDDEPGPAWFFRIVGEYGRGRVTDFEQDGRTVAEILSPPPGPSKKEQVVDLLVGVLERDPEITAKDAHTAAYRAFPGLGKDTLRQAWNIARGMTEQTGGDQ